MAARAVVDIIRMGRNGEGVGELPNGQLIFVAGGLPGERVETEVTEIRTRFARGRVTKILTTSPLREEPPCPVYQACGGCTFQHWGYAGELEYKEQRVKDALHRIGGFENPPVDHVRGAHSPYSYRTKGSFPWGGVTGHLTLGLFRRGTHDVVPVAHCAIQHPLVNEVLQAAVTPANYLGLPPYQERTGAGLLRHLVVRVSQAEERAVVMVVTTGSDRRLSPWADALMAAVPAAKGVAVNYNPDPGNRILGHETVTLAGQAWLTEEILGARFRLNPDAFFQVHPEQVAVLYTTVLEAVPATDEAWDLYAGVGTLAVLLARRARRVRAVELSPSAVAAGRDNARTNHAAVEFSEGAAEAVVPRLVGAGHRPGVVVVDPPRSGLRAPVIDALLKLRAARLIYVSCEPESLARDLRELASDYELVRAVPVDLFPRTDHVETVVTMARRG
jgi:23S rRNA (uracil1939-C5)-methyltransferase